jgi:hypothetical protein
MNAMFADITTETGLSFRTETRALQFPYNMLLLDIEKWGIIAGLYVHSFAVYR